MRTTDNDPNNEIMQACWQFFLTALAIVSLILLAMCFGACKTREHATIVPQVRTDTVQITKHQRDSIWLHDSVHVLERQSGDTIYLLRDRWHTKYIERATHDTLYHATHDTIPQPYPVEVAVEKPLTWWQKTRMTIGTIAIIIIIVLLGREAWKLWRMLH